MPLGNARFKSLFVTQQSAGDGKMFSHMAESQRKFNVKFHNKISFMALSEMSL